MDILWSPWRMAFLDPEKARIGQADSEEEKVSAETVLETPDVEHPDCVFCVAPARKPEHDAASLVLYRGQHNFVILNLYPYNSGHLMVVPYRHLNDVTLLTSEESGEMMQLLQRMVELLRAEYKPEGFNAGMNLGRISGAGIADHIHMHLVPRWSGDTNFMPVIGQTKVMPESIEATYRRLRGALEQQG